MRNNFIYLFFSITV